MKDTTKEKRLPVGAHLKRERELRDICLEEVSRVTRVRLAYLEALEQGRWSALPAEVYVRGYIRAYARFLGVDAEGCIARYLHEVPSARPAPPPVLAMRGLNGEQRRPLPALGETQVEAPTPAASSGPKALRAPRRLSFVLALLLLVLAALTISVIYYMNQPGDAGTDNRGPTTTETALFEVTG